MMKMEKSASARLPVARFWIERGDGLARTAIGVFQGLYRWSVQSVSFLKGAQARRAARRELYLLDDRLLNDIGLRRDQVDEFVDEMFRSRNAQEGTRVTRTVEAAGSEVIPARNDRHYQSAA